MKLLKRVVPIMLVLLFCFCSGCTQNEVGISATPVSPSQTPIEPRTISIIYDAAGLADEISIGFGDVVVETENRNTVYNTEVYEFCGPAYGKLNIVYNMTPTVNTPYDKVYLIRLLEKGTGRELDRQLVTWTRESVIRRGGPFTISDTLGVPLTDPVSLKYEGTYYAGQGETLGQALQEKPQPIYDLVEIHVSTQ